MSGTWLCGCPKAHVKEGPMDPNPGRVYQLHGDCTLFRHGTKYATLQRRLCAFVASMLGQRAPASWGRRRRGNRWDVPCANCGTVLYNGEGGPVEGKCEGCGRLVHRVGGRYDPVSNLPTSGAGA